MAPGTDITLGNWLLAPHNRWSLQHVAELVATAPIARAATPSALPREERDLSSIAFTFEGEDWTLARMLDATCTDGFLVLRHGTIVTESYFNDMTPATPHLCFSVTKSVVATIAGILVGRGLLDAAAPLPSLVPELAGTSWEGATVQHVLDMRTGTRFNEVYEDVEGDIGAFGRAYGWMPPRVPGEPRDARAYMAGLENDRDHGGVFDYRSVLTSMLGWICERVSGAPLDRLIAQEIWEPIGAEFDATMAVDDSGHGMGAGGLSASLRDLARFGMLWANGGRAGDRQVVPETFVADTLAGAPDSVAAFLGSADGPDPDFPHAFYRNKWWVMDGAVPLYAGLGIHGQYILIHGPASVVIAKFSSQPAAEDPPLERLTAAGLLAVIEALAADPQEPTRP
jgi:CubicO group peptidase (beta-lactamase class C family)